MNFFTRSFLPALAFAFVGVAVSRAQRPEDSIEKLDNLVKLSPAQETSALQIFTHAKDLIDSPPPEDKGQRFMASRQEALAAIRAILTPAQQAIYDATPQRLGGGSMKDPGMEALHQKVSLFVRHAVKSSADVAAKVGEIKTVTQILFGARMSWGRPDVSPWPDPLLHPESGVNPVRVTGTSGTALFNVYWAMSPTGDLTLAKIEVRPN